jgi:hypothetical protein
VCAEEIGFSKEGQNGKKGLCGADLILEKFESMRECVAYGPTECAEAKCVEKGFGLVSDSGSAVLEIFVVEAEARVDPDGVYTCLKSSIDLAAEVVE